MDGVVFAVDGQDGDFVRAGRRSEDLACGNHALFVGQADGLAGKNGRVRGFKARNANDGRDDEVRIGKSRAGNGASSAVDDFNAGDAGLLEPGGRVGRRVLRWPERRS